MGYRYRVCTQVPLETCDVVQNKQQPQRNIETHRHADYKKKVPHHSMSWVSNLLSHLLSNQCLSESGRERQTPKEGSFTKQQCDCTSKQLSKKTGKTLHI